jgi:hypothetical protein
MDYPLFQPPPPFFEKSHFDWTQKEARAYFDWFLAQVEPRTRTLLGYLDERDDADAPVLLGRIGQKVAALVPHEPFSTPAGAGRDLTNRGYALGADSGLLLARCILRDHPGVRWEILRKPKREMSFHLPVLVGCGPVHVDPIGATIANLHGVLRGEVGPSFLAGGYALCALRATARAG